MLNTEITALRSFIIEQLLVIKKKTAKETRSVNSSLSESNRLRDERRNVKPEIERNVKPEITLSKLYWKIRKLFRTQ